MNREDGISREERELLAGELIGAALRVDSAPGLGPFPIEGTIVDESMQMFTVRLAGGSRLVRLEKAGLHGTLGLGGRELPLRGELLRVRPQDRTKRLLSYRSRRVR